jgi:hypothetical protein
MNIFAFTLAAVPLAFASLAPPAADSYDFKRAFKVKDDAKYTFTMDMGGGMNMSAQVESTVVSVDGDSASVFFKALKLDMGMPNTEALPQITSKVGPTGMPNAASIKNSQEFFVFVGAAGITPGAKASVGDDVTVHWQNDPKDVTFDGHGKILSADKDAKTLTVQWTLTMTPSYTTAGEWKFKSVYSTDDFSLKGADGTMGMGPTTVGIKVVRDAS